MPSPRRLYAPLAVVLAVAGTACGSGASRRSGPGAADAAATTTTTLDATTASTATASAAAAPGSISPTTASRVSTTLRNATTSKAPLSTLPPAPSGISRATPLFPSATSTTTTSTTTTTRPPASGTITVFAAASLTSAFTELGQAFQNANPAAQVKFNFASSSTLATQINQGAPADVYASADDPNMKKVTDAGSNAGTPLEFATNKLQVIVTKANPKNITSVTDLAKSDIVSVTCDPSVPIGAYTQQVFQKAGITVHPKSYETDVKGIVTKVLADEADTGVVYATDVLAAGSGAAGVVIPDQWNVIANYPVTVLKSARDAYSAQVFMNFVLSPSGQTILAKYGFTGP